MLAFVGHGRQIDCFVSWYVTPQSMIDFDISTQIMKVEQTKILLALSTFTPYRGRT